MHEFFRSSYLHSYNLNNKLKNVKQIAAVADCRSRLKWLLRKAPSQ